MKTETQIAEENIKNLEWTRREQDTRGYIWKEGKSIDKNSMFWICEEQKASCQRFLEFFLDLKAVEGTTFNEKEKRIFEQLTSQKITDLKNAKKKYDEAGI